VRECLQNKPFPGVRDIDDAGGGRVIGAVGKDQLRFNVVECSCIDRRI
jgi:hypothetical protein